MKLMDAVESLSARGYIYVAPGNDKDNRMLIDDYTNVLRGDDTEDMEVVVDEYKDGTVEVVRMENGYRQDVWLVAYADIVD